MRVFNETDEGLVLNLFNNANNAAQSEGATTGMSLNVDLTNHKVTTMRNLSDPTDEVYSVSQGNVQFMGPQGSDHIFMGYGSISKVKEYDINGNTILSAQFGDLNAVASYRGYKCGWRATPFWKPVVVAKPTSDGASNVFMSWNGATEYDNWAVYAAPTKDSSDTFFIGSYKRTGFETKATLSNVNAPYIQVVARQGDKPLRASEFINF